MEPEWEDQGDLAAVECEFETDTVIANIGGYTPSLSGGTRMTLHVIPYTRILVLQDISSRQLCFRRLLLKS